MKHACSCPNALSVDAVSALRRCSLTPRLVACNIRNVGPQRFMGLGPIYARLDSLLRLLENEAWEQRQSVQWEQNKPAGSFEAGIASPSYTLVHHVTDPCGRGSSTRILINHPNLGLCREQTLAADRDTSLRDLTYRLGFNVSIRLVFVPRLISHKFLASACVIIWSKQSGTTKLSSEGATYGTLRRCAK